jgi:hypothetical protein
LARGLSRSQARGHPSVGQPHAGRPSPAAAYDPTLEEGVHLMREGSSFSDAATDIHVSRDRLRRYLTRMGVGVRDGRRWTIGPDRRPRVVPMYSRGRIVEVVVPGYEEAAQVGSYMAATGRFQVHNDPLVLAPYVGASVRDIRGRRHPFETDPNTLYRLMAAGPEPFELVYRVVV